VLGTARPVDGVLGRVAGGSMGRGCCKRLRGGKVCGGRGRGVLLRVEACELGGLSTVDAALDKESVDANLAL